MLLYVWRNQSEVERFGYWCLLLSLLTALLAGLSGVVDRGQLAFDDPRMEAIDRHVSASVGFMVINALLVYSRFRWPNILQSPHKSWYIAGLLAGAMVLTLSGHWGGSLVYELRVGIEW
jgi:uncharacterized membrane protein